MSVVDAGGPPRRVGRYLVWEAIASGGMATIHLGRLVGPEGFARTVAIKRLHPHLVDDQDLRAMLIDEAHLASRVRHPNVVSIVDVAEAETELLLVMDFVQGESLAAMLAHGDASRRPVPPAIACGIAVGVLRGLHSAHEVTGSDGSPLHLVHRDVSPSNVLVGTDGVARVLDFGIARAAVRLSKTREGTLKGKLAYIAPEVLRGGVATRHADIYATGIVLWEMLTGRRLFAGEDDVAVVEQILTNLVAPPSRYAPEVPDGLDAVVLRALRADASARFGTAREMADALERAARAASAQEIAAFVLETAGAAIASREARVRQVEAYGATPASLTGAGRPRRAVSAVADTQHVAQSTRPLPRWLLQGSIVGAAAVALLAVALLTVRDAGTPSPPAAAIAPSVPVEVAADEPKVAPSSEQPFVSPSATQRPPVPMPHPAHRRQSQVTPARHECAIPYTRDDHGTLHWKAECL
jgi:eukaryotic-like serine/threonine-protein kinase